LTRTGISGRARAAATLADEAELIYGLAQTIVEMNGVPDATHILDKLSKMAVWASMCRAGWTAALAYAATTEAGTVVPADVHVYATMAYGRSLFNEMVSYLHDVSGALLLTCPTVADYENPETHDYMEKYLRTMDGVTGEDRMKIFHVIRDLTADHYGGWAKISNQMVSGGLHAQRMATLRTFPSEAAKARVRRVKRIEGVDVMEGPFCLGFRCWEASQRAERATRITFKAGWIIKQCGKLFQYGKPYHFVIGLVAERGQMPPCPCPITSFLHEYPSRTKPQDA
jgi:hypothetical protein